MDSRYRFLTLGIPWTQRMPSCDVNAAMRLAETSVRRDKAEKGSKHCISGRNSSGHVMQISQQHFNLVSLGFFLFS